MDVLWFGILSLQKERKKKWDESNQGAISEALKELNDFDKVWLYIVTTLNSLSFIFNNQG